MTQITVKPAHKNYKKDVQDYIQLRTDRLMFLFTDDIQGRIQLKRYQNLHVGHCVHPKTLGLKPGMIMAMVYVYGNVYAWMQIHTGVYRETNEGNKVEVVKHHIIPVEELL